MVGQGILKYTFFDSMAVGNTHTIEKQNEDDYINVQSIRVAAIQWADRRDNGAKFIISQERDSTTHKIRKVTIRRVR